MKNIKALKKDLEIASEKKEKALNNIVDLGQKLNPLNTESILLAENVEAV
mgnify:CR=1 FL=1